MTGEAGVRTAFRQQAEWCRSLGSPFTSLLMALAAERLDRATPAGRRILDWAGPPDARGDAVPLRLAGGLHGLVRAGAAPALAALYPPHAMPDGEALWDAVAAVLDAPGNPIDPWLDSAPQTNEVARSAVLMPGLMVVAAETGLPLELFELGCSAGLNLVPDRYAYALGPVRAGDPASALHLLPDWRGPPPPDATVRIVARHGADLNPLDPTNPTHRARLLAYVWPDQPARLTRLATALDLATPDPPRLDRADAADWTETRFTPRPGVARVLMHSIAYQYFPPATQARIQAHLAAMGANATPDAPLAWLRLEVDPDAGGSPRLQLTLWPGTTRTLATASAHGHWVEWAATASPSPACGRGPG